MVATNRRIPRTASKTKVLGMLRAFFPTYANAMVRVIAEERKPLLEHWHEMLLIKFIRATTANADALEKAFSYSELYSLAFHARNLLELSVWTEYCGKSRSNAGTFSRRCVS